jgi:hypothetical protein
MPISHGDANSDKSASPMKHSPKQQELQSYTNPPTKSQTHFRVSSKEVISTDEVQMHPLRESNLNDVLIALARVVCLAVAIYNYATTRDLITFLILVGIAIDPSRVWEAVKLFTPKLPQVTKELKEQEEITNMEES